MNTALRSFVPNWFKHGESDMPDDNEIPPLPLTAIVPMPEPSEEEKRLKTIADAHIFVAQLGHERDGYRQTIGRLESEKAELETKLKQEQRKSGLLELDVAQHVNTIATLQAEVIEHKRLLDLLRDINAKSTAAFDRLNITGTKKERKQNGKRTKEEKRQATEGATTKDRTKADNAATDESKD